MATEAKEEFSISSSANLKSTATGALYRVRGLRVGDFYDAYNVTAGVTGRLSFLPIKLTTASLKLDQQLLIAAYDAALTGIMAAEIERITRGLVSVVSNFYNPKGAFQTPEPRYQFDGRNKSRSASFTAHFAATLPVDEAYSRQKSHELRRKVFGNLDKLEGFECKFAAHYPPYDMW